MEIGGMEVGGGSDEEQSTEEQRNEEQSTKEQNTKEQRHGTKRARPKEESLGDQKAPLSSSEPLSKKRRTQESPRQAGESSINESLQAGAHSGVRLLVKWTCEHLLTMNKGRTYQMGDTFSPNTFAQFSNALEQAVKANAPDLILKLLETGMQNCMPEALDNALILATSVGAHDVIPLLSTNSSSSSSSTTTLPNVCAPEQGWQKKINSDWKNIPLKEIIEAVNDQTNSTNACELLFGEKTDNWPKGEFRAETFDELDDVIKNIFDECGAVSLIDSEKNLVLFSSDFDWGKFRQRLLDIQHQEQTALQNREVDADNLPSTTPLMIAAQLGDLPTVQLLLENGANPVAVDINGTNPLMFASSKGHSDIVSLLLTYPININAKNEYGYTALSFANKTGSFPVCQLLFNHGAVLHNEEINPLYFAASHGDVKIINLLIEKGADVNEKFNKEATPLSAAADAGHLDACKLLVSKGADINHINSSGDSILALAISSRNPKLVEYLLAEGVALNNADESHPPLIQAACFKSIDIVKILLAQGADVNRPDRLGNTALFYSCKDSLEIITKLLLQAGADLNIENSDKETALVYAAWGGSIEIVKLLISYGAKLFTDRHYGFQALSKAVRGGHIDIATHLLQMNVPTNNIAVAVYQSSLIIQSFFSINDENAHIAMLQLLLSYGASLRECDFYGNDALMLALERKKTKVIFFLLEQEIKIGQLNNLRQNALHIAMNILDDSLPKSTSEKKIAALILARLLVNAQTQSDWLALRKEAIEREQHSITREIILLSQLWQFVIANLPYPEQPTIGFDLLTFERFIQFAITASPDILITQKIDYMLSLAGLCPALIEFIHPYILVLPQIKSHLFGNSLTIHPEIGLSFGMGMLATLEKIRVEHGDNWKPYGDESFYSPIYNALHQLANIELSFLIKLATDTEATKTALVFESLFETCFNFTVPAPSLLPVLPTYTAEAGALADALMRQGVYLSLATKIETAWQAAWSQFIDKQLISDSGSSSSASSSSSSSSSGSQPLSTAIRKNEIDDFFSDGEMDSKWIDELPEPPPLSFLESAQGQALLQTFRDELRLAVDRVGGNILDLPKGATEASAEAATIYGELMFRQVHMLKQFIYPDQPK